MNVINIILLEKMLRVRVPCDPCGSCFPCVPFVPCVLCRPRHGWVRAHFPEQCLVIEPIVDPVPHVSPVSWVAPLSSIAPVLLVSHVSLVSTVAFVASVSPFVPCVHCYLCDPCGLCGHRGNRTRGNVTCTLDPPLDPLPLQYICWSPHTTSFQNLLSFIL